MKLKQDHYILFAILAIFLVLEAGIRLYETRLSGNINHIHEIPEIVDTYEQRDKPSILFLGNSLINESVNIEQLDEQLGHRYRVHKITPDGTSVWDWSMILENQVFDSGADVKIDYLVMGFAWGLLSDTYRPNPSRLGGYFAGFSDYPELYRSGMNSFADLSEFGLGYVSKLFVNREAIRNKVMLTFIPYYERFVREANQAAGQPEEAQQSAPVGPSQAHSYRILDRLAERLEARGTRLVVIAMPVETPYAMDPDLIRQLQRPGVTFIDDRELFAGVSGVYKDGVHLNNRGSTDFTRRLGTYFTRDTHTGR
ncbi:MAG: hypothetical protein ABW076_16390 [Candidatus Thiodiazotropha sp.]